MFRIKTEFVLIFLIILLSNFITFSISVNYARFFNEPIQKNSVYYDKPKTINNNKVIICFNVDSDGLASYVETHTLHFQPMVIELQNDSLILKDIGRNGYFNIKYSNTGLKKLPLKSQDTIWVDGIAQNHSDSDSIIKKLSVLSCILILDYSEWRSRFFDYNRKINNVSSK